MQIWFSISLILVSGVGACTGPAGSSNFLSSSVSLNLPSSLASNHLLPLRSLTFFLILPISFLLHSIAFLISCFGFFAFEFLGFLSGMGGLSVLTILFLKANSFLVLDLGTGPVGCGDPSCFNTPSSWFIAFLLFGFLRIWFSKLHFFSNHLIFFGF